MRGISTVYSIAPSYSSKTVFRPMNFMDSYDTEDQTENGEPKELSYESASDTSNEFPTLKLSSDAIPAGNSA